MRQCGDTSHKQASKMSKRGQGVQSSLKDVGEFGQAEAQNSPFANVGAASDIGVIWDCSSRNDLISLQERTVKFIK